MRCVAQDALVGVRARHLAVQEEVEVRGRDGVEGDAGEQPLALADPLFRALLDQHVGEREVERGAHRHLQHLGGSLEVAGATVADQGFQPGARVRVEAGALGELLEQYFPGRHGGRGEAGAHEGDAAPRCDLVEQVLRDLHDHRATVHGLHRSRRQLGDPHSRS